MKRNRSLKWALNQFKNRCLQGWSYKHDAGWAKPTRIIFCLTLRCNIRCRQCAIWRMPNEEEITAEHWKRLISELREWIGPYRVQLAGGEIFVRKDVIDIIRHATEHDVLTGVVSNGTMIDAALAREIVGSGLGYIHISVDGIRAETHDLIRGIDGLHTKTVAALEHLQEARKASGMSLSVATVIMKPNMHELVDLVKWTENRGYDGILFNPLGPTIDSDPDWYRKTDLWFDDLAEINGVIDQLVDLKKNGARILNPVEQLVGMKDYFRTPSVVMGEGCMVGVTNLSITCDGNIHTCFKMAPLGNIKETTVQAAWTSEKAAAVRKQIRECTLHCSPGNFVYRRSLLSEVKRFLRFG